MRIILFAVAVIATFNSHAQNLIANPSFEIPKVNNYCPGDYAEVDELSNWQSRTQKINNIDIHSPDWLSTGCFNHDPFNHTVIPRTGTSAVFTSPEELIQQELSGALNEGLYIFEAYIKLYSTGSNGYAFNSDYSYYFRLRFSYNEMTYQSENNDIDAAECTNSYRNLNGTHMETILIPIQIGPGYLDSWQYITRENIKIFNFGYDWIGFDMVVFDGVTERPCSQVGIHVDDVSLVKDCCGDYIIYQDCDDLPVLTQRRHYIMAGTDVGAPHQTTGPVTIATGEHVKFVAGDAVYIENGFNPEPGAVYEWEIGPCEWEEDPEFYDYSIDLSYANQLVLLNCSGVYQGPNSNGFATNASFHSTGGGWYRIQIFNNIGIKIYDDMGPIHGLIQLHWNGAGTFTNDLQDEALAMLYIYNCGTYIQQGYSITYEYLNGCDPDFKMEYEIVSEYSCMDSDLDISLYPNPSTDIIKVKFLNITQETRFRYKVMDINSKVALEGSLYDNQIDLSKLAAGEYFVTLVSYNNELFKTFKIIKL